MIHALATSDQGVIVGGWGYVWAAYGFTWLAFVLYAASLFTRRTRSPEEDR